MNNDNKGKQLPEIIISLSFDKKVKREQLHKISSTKEAHQLFQQIFSLDTFNWREEMMMLCLNKGNQVVGYYKVSCGGVSSTVVDPKIVFTVALNCGASAIIIAHNHPSGALQPSEADKKMTQQIKEGGRLLDIRLFDHLILADDSYFSFAEDGVL